MANWMRGGHKGSGRRWPTARHDTRDLGPPPVAVPERGVADERGAPPQRGALTLSKDAGGRRSAPQRGAWKLGVPCFPRGRP